MEIDTSQIYLVLIGKEEVDKVHLLLDPDEAAAMAFEAWKDDLTAEIREIKTEELIEAGQPVPEQMIVKRIAKNKKLFQQPRKKKGRLRRIFGR